jgi:hypothetical protein
MKFTAGFEKDVDDRLLLPIDASVAGLAAHRKTMLFADKGILAQMFGGHSNRYRLHMKAKDIQWCWAIPISKTGHTFADTERCEYVLAIESNIPIQFFGEFGVEAMKALMQWPQLAGAGAPVPPNELGAQSAILFTGIYQLLGSSLAKAACTELTASKQF